MDCSRESINHAERRTPKNQNSQTKKWSTWSIVTALIAVLTVFAVFSHSGSISPAEIVEKLRGAAPFWLVCAFICMLGFIAFEGLALFLILKRLGHGRNLFQAMLFSASDIYFSTITPSATGGQPASAVLMARTKVPASAITATLIINLVMYTSASLIIGIACLAFRPDIFVGYSVLSKAFIVFSIVAFLVLALLFLGLMKRSDLVHCIGKGLVKFFHLIRAVRNQERWIEKLDDMTGDYKCCVRIMASHKRLLASVFFLNLLQRLSQISVVVMVFYALSSGYAQYGADLWFIQAYSQIGSNCIPIPGGMGVADYLMLDGFQMLLPADFAYELQIITRGVSFYLCTILSAIIVIVGLIATRRKTMGMSYSKKVVS